MSADIRAVTPQFATAPQLLPEDIEQARAMGFRLLINNRPDDEAPGQPSSADMEAAAQAAGLAYLHAPVMGAPTLVQVEAVKDAIAGSPGPVLAFCRSGTRSIVTWAQGELAAGRDRGELVDLGRAAGYDLSQAL